MANPDLQIRGEGRGSGHPDHKIRGWPGLKKFFFWPFGPHFGLKIRGGGPPGPSPRSATEIQFRAYLYEVSRACPNARYLTDAIT